jgi:hypothetical protein
LNAVAFKINVSDRLEQTDYTNTADLADVLIDEAVNLTPKAIRQQTDIEIIVNRLAEHTPEIRILIEAFNLIDANGTEIILRCKNSRKIFCTLKT